MVQEVERAWALETGGSVSDLDSDALHGLGASISSSYKLGKLTQLSQRAAGKTRELIHIKLEHCAWSTGPAPSLQAVTIPQLTIILVRSTVVIPRSL